MKVAELLARRRKNWQELEQLCDQISRRRKRNLSPATISRFAALYRAACADLALADSYQLPPNTVQYLHRLVGRAHNQLYRSRVFDLASWGKALFFDTPQRIFNDRCIQAVFCAFWGMFIFSAWIAYSKDRYPGYAEKVAGKDMLQQLDTSFAEPIKSKERTYGDNIAMAGFYIQHNTGIGLKSFASSLVIVPGLYITLYNASVLGTAFGYMAQPENYADGQPGPNFFHFVTAHGPFELTAIALAAGAGLRIGMGFLFTRGLTRGDSLKKTAYETIPHIGAFMVMFALAAFIEGFISPAPFIPYWTKATIAVLSSIALMFYFVVLGFPRRAWRAA